MTDLLSQTAEAMGDIPEIRDLADYISLEEQLTDLRSSQPMSFSGYVLALQLALLFRLNDYERSIGMPESEMPPVGEDGRSDAERLIPSLLPDARAPSGSRTGP